MPEQNTCDLNTILQVENIVKTFRNGTGTITAVNDISFSLHKGELLAIMGSSGSGKSTMLNIIGALENPDSGKIYLNGVYEENYSKEPYATDMRRKNIGFVFQEFNLLQDLSVRENISMPLILNGKKEKEIKTELETVLSQVGLSEKTDSPINQLSGGQRQRVAIARAIIARPKILLADEPTGNLDFNTSQEIMKLLCTLQQELKQSIILVTHDPVIAGYADRVIFFHDGRQVAEHQNQKNEDDSSHIIDIFRQLSSQKNTP